MTGMRNITSRKVTCDVIRPKANPDSNRVRVVIRVRERNSLGYNAISLSLRELRRIYLKAEFSALDKAIK